MLVKWGEINSLLHLFTPRSLWLLRDTLPFSTQLRDLHNLHSSANCAQSLKWCQKSQDQITLSLLSVLFHPQFEFLPVSLSPFIYMELCVFPPFSYIKNPILPRREILKTIFTWKKKFSSIDQISGKIWSNRRNPVEIARIAFKLIRFLANYSKPEILLSFPENSSNFSQIAHLSWRFTRHLLKIQPHFFVEYCYFIFLLFNR